MPSTTQALRLTALTPIREAGPFGVDAEGRTARCVLISEGLGNLRDRNYYTKPAIESAIAALEGKQFYVDHPTRSEEKERPERTTRDLAGYFYDCRLETVVDPDTGEALRAVVGSLRFSEAEPGTLAMQQVQTALAYQKQFPRSKDIYAGISINATGLGEPGVVDGMQVNLVHEIQDAFSADIVTRPARGGRFLQLMQEAERAAAWKRSRRAQGGAMATATQRRKEPVRTLDDGKKVVVAAKEANGDEPKGEEERKPDGEEQKAGAQEANGGENGNGGGENGTKAASDAAVEQDMGATGAPDEKPEKPGMLTLKSLGEKMKMLNAAMDRMEGMHPNELIADIQADLAELLALITQQEPGLPEKPGLPEEEPYLGEQAAGMLVENQNGSPDGDAMRYTCPHCERDTDVLPPEGYSLVRSTEAAAATPTMEARALQETVSRLEATLVAKSRALEAKEGRFVEANERIKQTSIENAKLKAKLMAYERRDLAETKLREAGLPEDALTVADLLPYEPHQWPALIVAAKRQIERERKLLEGGAGPHLSGEGKQAAPTIEEVCATFEKTYSNAH